MTQTPPESEPLIPFWDHVEQLRRMLLRILAVWFLLSGIGYGFSDRIISWLTGTFAPDGFVLHYFSPMEPFFVQLKVGCLTGIWLVSPYALYELWRFVSPAFPGNRKRVWPWLTGAVLGAAGGIGFCVFAVLPLMIRFGLSFQGPGVEAVIGMDAFISLCAWLILAFGVMFEFPIAVLFALRAGWVSAGYLSRLRPYLIVGLLIAAAVLTPPDVISQLMLFFPAWLLFELALLFGRGAKKSKKEPLDG